MLVEDHSHGHSHDRTQVDIYRSPFQVGKLCHIRVRIQVGDGHTPDHTQLSEEHGRSLGHNPAVAA